MYSVIIQKNYPYLVPWDSKDISHPIYDLSEVRWGQIYFFGANPNHLNQIHGTEAGILCGQTCEVI